MKDIKTHFLKCPSSKSGLTLKEDELFSESTSYPIFNGVPLLYDDIEQEFLSCATKLNQFNQPEKIGTHHLKNLIQIKPDK